MKKVKDRNKEQGKDDDEETEADKSDDACRVGTLRHGRRCADSLRGDDDVSVNH